LLRFVTGAELVALLRPHSLQGRLDRLVATCELVHQLLAAPREIYDIRNRDRVDWSTLPEWARPSDPDLFEGCAHEG